MDGLTRVPLKSRFKLTKFSWIKQQFIYTFKRQNHSLVRAASCPVLTYYITQRAEAILNKISNIINKTHTGLISVLQGFQKCIA